MSKRIGLAVGVVFLMLCSCTQTNLTEQFINLENLVHKGEFLQASKLIEKLKETNKLTEKQYVKTDSLMDLMHRIRLDFSRNKTQIRKQLIGYFNPPNDSMLLQWEQTGKLEMRSIDGKKQYFNNAVPNLFRLDAVAAARKLRIEGAQVDSLNLFCLEHTSKIISESKNSSNTVLPVSMVLTYTIHVKPNAVPDGEIIRCWMPFPKAGNPRQRNFKLLLSDPDSAVIAPEDYLQRSVYIEKKSRKDQSTDFRIQFSVRTSAQYFNLKPEDIKSYDTNSELFCEYSSECPPHLVFSEKIKKLGGRLIGDEKNPLHKVQKIYTWINDSIIWASALEYSIIPNIPEYVLTNRHGDCGMQTLLFMCLARSQGIPVKWQSGWMLHPGHVNLHDWCEVYYEGIGWVPLDQSFGLQDSSDKQIREFYMHGIDSYRLIVNDDYARKLFPPKEYLRSEPCDFQRGEVEWSGGNLYFDQWSWHMDVDYR